nr:stage II sporulation protein P [uncultured Blautia sp.]
MTNFQKAFCIVLSMCFFATLAVLPGALFTGENVYRHLPLYRFLEEKTQVHSYEDQETYEKIAGENGKYLGRQAQSELIKAEAEMTPVSKETPEPEEMEVPTETPEPEETEAPTETPEPEETEVPVETPEPEETPASDEAVQSGKIPELSTSEEPDFHDSAETLAAVLPHPEIDLSPAKLADYDYLLGQFYIVDSNTEADAVQINAEDFLKQDLKISKDTETPQILIYHSHSQETFADSREGEEADTIVGVGDYLTRLLTETYGYQVIHLKEQFDMASGELDRSAAYDYARDYLEPYLQENPNIQVIIDLHRDGVPEDRRLVTEINGKPTAQILFYNGLSYTTARGSLDYLPNPYIQQNLAFSFQLEYQAAQYYPEFYRGIYLAGYRYNLHFRPRSILLEAGAQTNTVQEVKNAMEPFADILNKVLQG